MRLNTKDLILRVYIVERFAPFAFSNEIFDFSLAFNGKDSIQQIGATIRLLKITTISIMELNRQTVQLCSVLDVFCRYQQTMYDHHFILEHFQ